MAQVVNVPGVGQLSFPDDMSQSDMAAAIQKNFPQIHSQPEPEKPSMLSELGRQVGLTARAGINGLTSIPAMVSDAVTGPLNAGLDLVRGKGNGFRFERASAAINNLMNEAGVPEPQNARERFVQDTASAMAGAGSFVGAGKAIAGMGGELATGIGKSLSAGPGLQTVSAATGAGASDVVREHGGGAGAQLTAGLAGALVPGVAPFAAGAVTRGLLRGGEAGRQAAADNIAAFNAAGTEPTLGQATGNRLVQGTESLLNKVPGGTGVMGDFANKQADDMAKAVQTLSDELAPGASAANAGEAITRGVTAFKDGIKSVQQRLYAHLDDYIPADTPIPVTKTQEALASLNADIPGAPNLSQFFINSKIKGIDSALQADLERASNPISSAVGGGAMGEGAMPYEAIKKLRTLVGNEIADNSLVSDVPRSKWTALYGALSDDLGTAAQAAGPEASHAWSWANQFTRTQMTRLEQLSGIISKDSPEKIFSAAVSGTAEGDTIAKRVISVLPMAERGEVAAALLQRMGRSTPGQQNAMGDAFSTETFLTNLSKISPEARQTIFGRTDHEGILDQLHNFAQVAGSRRAGGKVFSNPSGTAQSVAQISIGSGIAGGIASAAMGHPVPLVAALGLPTAAYTTAKAVTGPMLREMAETPTSFGSGFNASLVNAASHINAGSGDTIKRISEAKTVDEAIAAMEGVQGVASDDHQETALGAEIRRARAMQADRKKARIAQEMVRRAQGITGQTKGC